MQENSQQTQDLSVGDEIGNLDDALGGNRALEDVLKVFYDRLFDDVMIGFFFSGKDKSDLIRSQAEYLRARLGTQRQAYRGPSIRQAHAHLPILVGHFDRRHQILKEVLEECDVPEAVRQSWLALDLNLRDFVVQMGASRRDAILQSEPQD